MNEAGFPLHPHRGIETVTYVLAGAVHHKDALGNSGSIGAGDIQWMTAGGGIMHEEMPQVRPEGVAGFQLWVNLPAALKMSQPRYQEVNAATIQRVEVNNVLIEYSLQAGWTPLHADANQDSDDISVLLNGGGGAFGPAASYPTMNFPCGLAAGDLDGDGDADWPSSEARRTSSCGEGSWTVDTAGELGIRVPIIEASLNFRIQSQENPSYAGQLLSAMRNQFGGHDVFIKRQGTPSGIIQTAKRTETPSTCTLPLFSLLLFHR